MNNVETDQKQKMLTRIESIVRDHYPSPIGLSNLDILYEKKFDEKFQVKQIFGNRKLSNIIRDIPNLDTLTKKSECFAYVRQETSNGERNPILKQSHEKESANSLRNGMKSVDIIGKSHVMQILDDYVGKNDLDKESDGFDVSGDWNRRKSQRTPKIENHRSSQSSNVFDQNEDTYPLSSLNTLDDKDATSSFTQTLDMEKKYVSDGIFRKNLLGTESSSMSTNSFSFESSVSEKKVSPGVKEQKKRNFLRNHFQSHIPYGHFEISSLCNIGVFRQLEAGALLGHLIPNQQKTPKIQQSNDEVYLSTKSSFCLAAIGTQGCGKSHTLSCILENCLIPFPMGDIVKLPNPMTALTLYYDQNEMSTCDAISLLNPDIKLTQHCSPTDGVSFNVPRKRAVILVSPTFYENKRYAYDYDKCDIHPLLFNWRSLNASQIMQLMNLQSACGHLDTYPLLNLLRHYQRRLNFPSFSVFINDLRKVYTNQQELDLLDQKISLLESWVAESDTNLEMRRKSLDLETAIDSGKYFIVADLCDPLLTTEEVNRLFQILIHQYRTLPINGRKVLALDGIHKLINDFKNNELVEALVETAQSMRHNGMSIAITTENPRVLPSNFLGLVSIAIFHYFHSGESWTYLQKHFPLENVTKNQILSLKPGDAMVFAASHNLGGHIKTGAQVFPIRIRTRITADESISRKDYHKK